ncbi:MAG: Mur ligase family protein [Candidatus Margulisiibacteriota bacterium]|jgi:UDP-N-acetylmuramoyl-tripeptide--D-alanyl-D-alanine ligase
MAISIDTRTIKPGDIFIPIKGQNFDGHDYIPEAVKKGAAVLAVDLSQYAASQRLEYDIPVIAVTGSSGKTTTKDRVAALLGAKYRVLKTEENQNNEVGVPLTVLRLLGSDYQAAVIELAMRGLGEIAHLTKIVQPTHVVITNIGTAHIGRLGSRENICRAKCEILNPTKYSQKAFLNEEDDFFEECKKTALANGWQVIAFKDDPLPQIADEFGVPSAELDKVQMAYSSNRMEIIKRNGVTIINDSYNANPDSVKWAIKQLMKIPGRKVAVLGDMLELGEDEVQFHKAIDLQGVEEVFTFGPLFYSADITPNRYKDKQPLVQDLKSKLRAGDVILVKGSRGMKMEEVVAAL